MQLYAADPIRRVRQLVADVVALVAIVLAVLLGRAVGASIAALGDVGRRVQDAGEGFRSTMSRAADRIADLPFAGRAVSTPFRNASDAARTLVAAGRDQQEAAHHVAVLVGVVVAGLPVLLVVVLWLRRRGGFVRRAAAVRALLRTPLGLEALAAQALAHAHPRTLRAVEPTVVERWRAGEPDAVRVLATLALRDAGVPLRLLPR
ncbi:hypothetical protein [Curtobacterium sp. MCBD17_003]|uniref:hypothetical protein n=1 Tax=Curtobacterium sp. MCBD17_003 TaxID=2175667 RepID=UPI000DAAD063|nr:hypothetical protein [Curtobacterium sp. MCBD17_003]WIE54429.1 hypothetical protein DEI88_015125 [Curtobacterium sp. MCBD17_003]